MIVYKSVYASMNMSVYRSVCTSVCTSVYECVYECEYDERVYGCVRMYTSECVYVSYSLFIIPVQSLILMKCPQSTRISSMETIWCWWCMLGENVKLKTPVWSIRVYMYAFLCVDKKQDEKEHTWRSFLERFQFGIRQSKGAVHLSHLI